MKLLDTKTGLATTGAGGEDCGWIQLRMPVRIPVRMEAGKGDDDKATTGAGGENCGW